MMVITFIAILYYAKFGNSLSYEIVGTGQTNCFNTRIGITCPFHNQTDQNGGFFGQDGNYIINPPSFRNNGDGTISDLVTGLMWQRDPGEKMTWQEADTLQHTFSLGGYDDWRLPSIKELYSLIDFRGLDGMSESTPFIDTNYFEFQYGQYPERTIDAQYATSSIYVGTTMGGSATMFGVNFADGRIKGYPYTNGKEFFVLFVRGNNTYGINDFVDNVDGTITDRATGLMWQKADSGSGMNWKEALECVKQKNNENHLGYDDWRLPHVKELESIVDYTKSPQIGGNPAIDETFFDITQITDEKSSNNFAYFWSSTTHATQQSPSGSKGSYVCFGECLGYFANQWQDVHGAGAQRSDPKEGSASDYPYGFGPQGDAIRIDNYVRMVRGGSVILNEGSLYNEGMSKRISIFLFMVVNILIVSFLF